MDFGDVVPRLTHRTITATRRNLHVGIELAKRLECDVEAGDHAVGLREDDRAGTLIRPDRRCRGDVRRADVLRQSSADQVAIFARVERLE